LVHIWQFWQFLPNVWMVGDSMELKRKSFFKKLLKAPKFYRKQAAILKKYRGGRRVALALTWRYLMDRTIAERR